MVGAPGFEPGTSRTPSVRATRLRYAPTDGGGFFRAALRRAAMWGIAMLQSRVQLQGYHRRSRSVKKARSESRKSSSILRLSI